jgi:Tol biopolymer transport system component
MGRGPDGAYLTSYPAGVTEIIPCTRDGGALCQGEGPSFSGDGQWITHEEGLKIMKVPRAGGVAQTVVGGLRDVTKPAWSPNNKYIAFVMQGTSYQFGHIWVADSRGQTFGLWQVTDGDFRDSEPTWSADSRTIYFTRNDSAFSAPTKIYGIGFSAL